MLGLPCDLGVEAGHHGGLVGVTEFVERVLDRITIEHGVDQPRPMHDTWRPGERAGPRAELERVTPGTQIEDGLLMAGIDSEDPTDDLVRVAVGHDPGAEALADMNHARGVAFPNVDDVAGAEVAQCHPDVAFDRDHLVHAPIDRQPRRGEQALVVRQQVAALAQEPAEEAAFVECRVEQDRVFERLSQRGHLRTVDQIVGVGGRIPCHPGNREVRHRSTWLARRVLEPERRLAAQPPDPVGQRG